MAEKLYSHCLICRRKLKNPEWKRRGFGAKCYKKYMKKSEAKLVQLEMKI